MAALVQRHSGSPWKKYSCGEDLNAGQGHLNVCCLQLKHNKGTGVNFACKWVSRQARGDIILDLAKEAVLLRALDHPSIVKLKEIFIDTHNIYLVMKYLSGPSLFHHLLKQPESRYKESVARAVFRQCVSAIAYCHSYGIYHGDIKLDNFVYDNQGRIVLIDFGLSKLVVRSDDDIMTYARDLLPIAETKVIARNNDEKVQLEESNSLHGQVDYLAPEILETANVGDSDRMKKSSLFGRAKSSIKKVSTVLRKDLKSVGRDGRAADVWSLGVLLYTLLAGKFPFSPLRDPQQVNQKEIQRNISKEGRQLVEKMLKKNPRNRLSAIECLQAPWFSNGATMDNLPYKLEEIQKEALAFSKLSDEEQLKWREKMFRYRVGQPLDEELQLPKAMGEGEKIFEHLLIENDSKQNCADFENLLRLGYSDIVALHCLR
eukprot:g3082.t1